MNVKEAAQRLEIGQTLCYQLISEGRLTCLRVGGRGRRGKIVVRESDVEAFLKAAEAATEAKYARLNGRRA